jgi:hypothetical protein
VASYSWIPNDGALVINWSANAIGSLYFNKVDFDIAFTATPTPPNGNPFYVTAPPTMESNPQVVPMPLGTTAVSLSGSSSSTYYIIASSNIYKPSMEGPAR